MWIISLGYIRIVYSYKEEKFKHDKEQIWPYQLSL
jgi:hypothetical protein